LDEKNEEQIKKIGIELYSTFLWLLQSSSHDNLFSGRRNEQTSIVTFTSIPVEKNKYGDVSSYQEIVTQRKEDMEQLAMHLASILSQSSSSSSSSSSPKEVEETTTMQLISELLRTMTNFTRWIMSSKSNSAASKSLTAFLTKGTICLSLTLLELSASSAETELNQQVARNASVLLFRTTHSKPNPLLQYFWITKNGYKLIAKLLLLSDISTPLLFSVVRHVHHVVASFPKRVGLDLLNDGLRDQQLLLQREEEEKSHEQQQQVVADATTVLIATLAWCIKSSPAFPGKDRINDRRSDVALEILRILFALGGSDNASSANNNNRTNNPHFDLMTQMGILLGDILHLPNANVATYEVKVASVSLLMDTPINYGYYLLANDCIRTILDVLELQVSSVVLERDVSGTKSSSFGGDSKVSGSKDDAAALTPILIVLIKYGTANPEILRQMKERIFPKEECDELYQKAIDDLPLSSSSSVSSSSIQRGGGGGAKNMSPIDNPSKRTLRYKVIKLMTWSESNIKRLSAELMWILCNSDPTEFILRTGFGNAVHMLGMRGFVNIPEGNSSGGVGIATTAEEMLQQ